MLRLEKAVDLVSLGLSITALSYIVSYYVANQDVYFIGHGLGLFITALGVKRRLIRDVLIGFSFGRLYDEFYFFLLGNEETLLSWALLFVVLVPLLGYCWRRYRKKTAITVVSSAIAYGFKWIIIKVVQLLDIIYP